MTRLHAPKLGQCKKKCGNSNYFWFEPSSSLHIWRSAPTLQSALILEGIQVSLPVAWQSQGAGLTLIIVEYSTSAAVSAEWAFPHGFGTIKPPQDMGLIEWKARGVWLSVRQRVSEKEAKQNERERDYRVWWPWQPCGRVVFTVLDFDWGKLSEPSGSPAGWGWDCSLSFFTHRDPLEMADQMGRKASGSNCWFVWTAWDGLKAENLCMCASELVCLYSRRESVSVW